MTTRFWAKVDTTGDCWLWTGKPDKDGYGRINAPGRPTFKVKAHRYSAMLHFGMFDSRTMVLHRCNVRACIRPEHLYLGDNSDNQQDAVAAGNHYQKSKTHCKQGHPYNEENTFLTKRGRGCKECRKVWNRRQYLRRAGFLLTDEGTRLPVDVPPASQHH